MRNQDSIYLMIMTADYILPGGIQTFISDYKKAGVGANRDVVLSKKSGMAGALSSLNKIAQYKRDITQGSSLVNQALVWARTSTEDLYTTFDEILTWPNTVNRRSRIYVGRNRILDLYTERADGFRFQIPRDKLLIYAT